MTDHIDGMTFEVEAGSERVAIRARLPEKQHQAWRQAADDENITLAGLLVAITPRLDDILDAHPDIVPDARAFDIESRRRPKR